MPGFSKFVSLEMVTDENCLICNRQTFRVNERTSKNVLKMYLRNLETSIFCHEINEVVNQRWQAVMKAPPGFENFIPGLENRI